MAKAASRLLQKRFISASKASKPEKRDPLIRHEYERPAFPPRVDRERPDEERPAAAPLRWDRVRAMFEQTGVQLEAGHSQQGLPPLRDVLPYRGEPLQGTKQVYYYGTEGEEGESDAH